MQYKFESLSTRRTHKIWVDNYKWPTGYNDPDFGINRPIFRKRSSSKLSEDEASSSQGAPSEVSREVKSRPYKDARCERLLAAEGAFMDEPDGHFSRTMEDPCPKLLDTSQAVPQRSRFQDNVFKKTLQRLRTANKAQVIKEMTFLIVPSAQDLADFGSSKLDNLIEKVNSYWLKCLPFATIGKCPQPDYSVGFDESAFSQEQVRKLTPFIGKPNEQCSVMARWDMYFPFLTCEVKCGAEALSVVDRQNMHSASVAVKGVVELFKRASR